MKLLKPISVIVGIVSGSLFVIGKASTAATRIKFWIILGVIISVTISTIVTLILIKIQK